MFENIYYYNGKIVFNDLDMDTFLFLKEMEITEKDLLFVEYPEDFALDVDWHDNVFFVSIIKNDDWDNRIVKKRCETLDELKIAIEDSIAVIQTMIKECNKK